MIRARNAIGLVMLALGLTGCAGPAAPSALQRTPQPGPEPAVYTLTPSTDAVAASAALSVSWTASRGGTGDWIGLFKVGASDCDHGWSTGTKGATSGTLALSAPAQSGAYEFRYLPDDGCSVAARSSAVMVGQGG